MLKFNSGFFTAGGWGSFDFSGYQEADLFVSFALPAGFSLGVSNFNVCNVGLGVTRSIRITDSFSIPVVGQIIVNPERQKMYIVVGFTL